MCGPVAKYIFLNIKFQIKKMPFVTKFIYDLNKMCLKNVIQDLLIHNFLRNEKRKHFCFVNNSRMAASKFDQIG